jgi:hypothetical protein
MKKVTWQPPNLEVLNYFGLYIPAYDQPSDDTLMDPKHVLWKYGIPRDQLVRLVLRPKGPKRDFETVCLKVKVDNEPPINLLFYTISTIAKVVQKIKYAHKELVLLPSLPPNVGCPHQIAPPSLSGTGPATIWPIFIQGEQRIFLGRQQDPCRLRS